MPHSYALLRTMRTGNPYGTPDVFIETGILNGNTTYAASKVFPLVEAIDISPYLCHQAHERFKHTDKVRIFEGDSAIVFPARLREHARPVFAYLDAHYFERPAGLVPGVEGKGQFPLYAELEALASRPYADTVLVDDVSSFGRKSPRIDAEWEHLSIERILDQFPGRVHSHAVKANGLLIYLKPRDS